MQVYDVNQLIKQFAETRKLMKQFQAQSGKGKRRMRIPGMPPEASSPIPDHGARVGCERLRNARRRVFDPTGVLS